MAPSTPLLDQTLRAVARRYRLPSIPTVSSQRQKNDPAAALAIAIEKAREAMVRGDVPDDALKRLFIENLALMIQEAMRPQRGDPAFQATVLQHQATQVREYALLSAHANQDRRLIRVGVNAIAHPARLQRISSIKQREALAQLHALASSASWSELFDATRQLLVVPQTANETTPLGRKLMRLLDNPALERLRRLQALASDELVQRYQSLRDRHGPRSGSTTATTQGAASQQRGAAVEALATRALEALARRLNEAEGPVASYRVVTSMRVPASILASSERAKGEWDAVLLRQAKTANGASVWDVCLLIEAKASVDAATTDFPRLLRGLRLLATAEENGVYPFTTQQGLVCLRGVSLNALTTNMACLKKTVLYCCDAPAEETPRLLSAASRMQLLSALGSMEFASALAEKRRQADPQVLGPVWHHLWESPRWGAVLNQYQTLFNARELMVHTEDFLAAALA